MPAWAVVVGVLLWLLGTGLAGYLILTIDRDSSPSSPALNSERDRRRRASRLIA